MTTTHPAPRTRKQVVERMTLDLEHAFGRATIRGIVDGAAIMSQMPAWFQDWAAVRKFPPSLLTHGMRGLKSAVRAFGYSEKSWWDEIREVRKL